MLKEGITVPPRKVVRNVPAENESACRDFTFCISEYFFEESVNKKLTMVNFLAVLCDGSMEKSVTEQ